MVNFVTRSLYVLEDVSKTKFGGGQVVTVSVLDIVANQFNHRNLFCFGCSNILHKAAKKLFFSVYENRLTLGVNTKFETFIFFILIFPLSFIKLFYLVFNDPSNEIVIYSTTKKALILNVFVSCLFYQKVKSIHHCHQVENRGFLYQKLLEQCDIVFFVSKLSKGEYSGNNSELLYNSVKLLCRKHDEKYSNVYSIAYIGQLTKQKGVIDFIKIAEDLKGKAIFFIYGKGPLECDDYFLSSIKSGVINYRGFINNVQEEIANNIDLVVYPSYHVEAFPMVVIETLSSGKPIITNNLGGHIELFNEQMNMFLCPSGEIELLRDKVIAFIENKDQWDFVAQQSSKVLTACSEDVFKEKLINAFQ